MDDRYSIDITDKKDIIFNNTKNTVVYSTKNLKDLCAIKIGLTLNKSFYFIKVNNNDAILRAKNYCHDYFFAVNSLYLQHCSKVYKHLEKEAYESVVPDFSNDSFIQEFKIISDFVWIAKCRNIAAKFYNDTLDL